MKSFEDVLKMRNLMKIIEKKNGITFQFLLSRDAIVALNTATSSIISYHRQPNIDKIYQI